MISLIKNIQIASLVYNGSRITTQLFSTNTKLHLETEVKEVILKYLDGKDNGIVVLGLNRPNTRNAFGKNLVSQLNNAISTIKQDDKLRVLIIRSLVPFVFCAGADLYERLKMSKSEVSEFVTSLRNIMNDIESISIPVISAIDGVALGGGLELALATDIRIAALEAKLGLVETKLAIIPGAGGTQRLPRIVGSAIAKELIYTARILNGQQAKNIHLVNEVVLQNKNGDAAYQAALSLAREILPNGPIGVKLAKEAISKGIEMSIEDGLEIEKQCYNKVINTEDRLEGLSAFTAKRVPIYKGI
ncbi:methylglutaconyl-CoA hydratase, mitochondrial-like [Vespa velutina]|uniref:methylglutaconyl-CoA hydratase, mitochondrial-like n=1 Tax=Vespa velutina TaxID=202808 RepID=UPI001FB27F0D|nr:methylglutaconyl-CoA hydratase, mitochondrial-like [Vespa velutina]